MLNKKANFLFRFILRPILIFFYKVLYHPQIVNKELIPKDGKIILIGNHVNNLDPCNVIVSTKRLIYFLAKSELFSPWYGFVFKSAGCISVDCNHKSHSSLESAILHLKDNDAICLFPEGQVKRDNTKTLLPFKNGVIKMAKETNSLIVPFAITGNYKLFINNLKITFSKPIDITNVEYEKANEILFNTVYDLIKEENNRS